MDRLKNSFTSEKGKFAAFACFLTIVCLLGGAARDDVASLILLRPLAILFAAYASMQLDWATIKSQACWPLAMLTALALIMALQLVPLPFSVWTLLPERAIFAEIADLGGIGEIARPMSLAPSRTLNSLYSLYVPLAAILLYIIQDTRRRRDSWYIFIILGILSAVIGLFQSVGSPDGPLYFYRITNNGLPVGLFSNRNHSAMMAAILLGMSIWSISSINPRSRSKIAKTGLAVFGTFSSILIIIMAGSRAGIASAIIALLVSILFLSQSKLFKFNENSRFHGGWSKLIAERRWLARLIMISGLLFVGTAVYFSFADSLSMRRIATSDIAGELRFQILPILNDLAVTYLPFGSGFGSFEYVFKVIEPLDLLSPSYLNHAHNDWLEFVIEGGFPAVAVLFVFVIWLLHRLIALKLWRSENWPSSAFLALFVITVLGAMSFFDYPLRVPYMMILFTVSCMTLELKFTDRRQNKVRADIDS